MTREDAEQYWGYYDELELRLEDAWLDYMRVAGARVMERLLENPQAFTSPTTITALLEDLAAERDALVQVWVGDKQRPGAMARVVMAGAAAGADALERERAAAPPGEG